MAQEFCRDCGGQGDEFGLTEITGYDWDSSDEMALSEKRVIGHQCANRSYCARQTVGNPNATVRALQTIAADSDNFGELATQARTILDGYAQIAQQQAHTRDLVAREHGTRSPSRFVQADLLRTWCARDDPRSAYVHIGDSLTRMGYRKVKHISRIADDLWDVLVDGDMHTNAMTGDTSIFVREDTN